MAGGPIVRGVPLARGHRVPWLGWLGGAGSGRLNNYVAGLASHSEASSSLHPNIGEFFPPPRRYWCGISLSSSGLARMRHLCVRKNTVQNHVCHREKICVQGGQGSPQQPNSTCGLLMTPGSSMNRRVIRLAACAPYPVRSAFSELLSGLPRRCFRRCRLSSPRLCAESASSDFKRGQAAEAREDYDTAVDLYQKAIAKAPRDLTYTSALYRVRVSASGMHMTKGRRLLAAGDEQGALTEFLHAAESIPPTSPRNRRSPRSARGTARPYPTAKAPFPRRPHAGGT